MPEGTPPIRRDAGSDRTERLNAAIDRMLAGGPSPVLNDPDLFELLQLAARLRDELPGDLPDPAFRLDLKQQLTANGPRAVPRQPATPVSRFPWVSAVSAIAAVLLAAVSVGALGIWIDTDKQPSGQSNLAGISADQLTATTFGIATFTAETIAATSDAATTPGGDRPSSMTALQPTSPATSAPDSTEAVATLSAATETPGSDTTRTTATVAPTGTSDAPSLASVPPVDSETVEQGPQPASDGGGGEPAAGISYVLDTALPDLGNDAAIYRLAPPAVEPELFVADVAKSLGLKGEIISDAPQGRAVYHIFDDSAGSFHWTPETGAFTLSTAEADNGDPVPLDQVVHATRQWLSKIGYPVDQLATDMSAEPMGATSWRLEARYASMPDIGLGHPLGVTIFVNDDGAITEASGYWLRIKDADSALLLPADDVWQEVSSGHGLWTGGGIVTGGGEFRADQIQITYILTRDPSGDLVLQPVVQVTGDFTTPDGLSTARISCFIQAARTTDDNSP
ncbi:MAG TPA: hypothetical protein VFV93_17475 [Thermomicrobiales bacterium]|nr:hypothetical protein [Thermomicrobiales bacterium]